MTFADAVTWMSRLAAVAAGVAALELAWVHRAWRTGPLALVGGGRLAAIVFGTRGTAIAIALLFASAVLLPWTSSCAPAWTAAAAALALSIRFRGAYNGGSDAMLWLVLVGLALARTAPDTSLGPAGLAYVAAQLVLSYAIAGVAKLGDGRWRAGTALALVATFPRYGVPAPIRTLLSNRPIAWSVIAFELAFPLALVDPRACEVVLAVGALFHFGNAVAFGLNRFLWTWLAAYPALLFWATRLHA